ncbi:co-chaperone DjlA [Methylomagnum sp.]
MAWLGKFVGGAFGFIMGGPLGAVFGAALGHQLDRNAAEVGLLETDFGAAGLQHRVQMAFFTATFSVMGHIAKCDGRVTEAEIEAARGVMNRMSLPEPMRQAAIRLYNQGKQPAFPLDAAIAQFYAECRHRHSLLRMFVEIQIEAALADSALHEAEERLLLHVCEHLRFSRFEFFAIKMRMEAERRFAGSQRQSGRRELYGSREPSLSDAYAVLGLTASAAGGDVKRAYRRLMSQHHPDKLVANGMPEEMVRLATEKTQQIRKAYEVVSKSRQL